MKNPQRYTEPISTQLRRYSKGDKEEIISIVRWVGVANLFLFITLTTTAILTGYTSNALVTAVGLLPILMALRLLKHRALSAASTILAVTNILLITWLATLGQGLYDVGVLGFPVILIVAGLILRGRAVMYLAFLIIACVGWLSFGSYFDLYHPNPVTVWNIQDFFIVSIIILVGANAIYRLVKNVYFNLEKAEQELENRLKAEQDREILIQQLRTKNKELDRFAIRVSHDLKTPLITLAGFLGYLDKDLKQGDQERASRDMQQINEAAKTMGKFVDELLDLSRVGRIINPPKDVAFGEIVDAALKATEGLIHAKQVEVKLEADFPIVHVDRSRIVQVMQNLITNAVKFMGDQTHPLIEIGCTTLDDGRCVFWVRDNGMGIAPDHHERIFELFSKLHPDIEGTGIGLGVVKKIVEVHQGKIWVESEMGHGATFKFTLGAL